MGDKRQYSIGELAAEFGLTTRSIRFYEQEGLLKPLRRGQNRIYGEADRVRLRLILRGKRLAFSLAEIREVFDLYDSAPGGDRRQLERMLDILAQKRTVLQQQLQDIELLQAELDETEARCREALAALGVRSGRKKAG